jgi:hypothetical protein
VVTFKVVVQGFRGLLSWFRVLVLGCSVFVETFRVVMQGLRIK